MGVKRVRVLCVDSQQRILMLHWRDPLNGATVWEPPGGGIEDNEQPVDAARRELDEETGLSGRYIEDRYVQVTRDVRWNGKDYSGKEAFFLARFNDPPEIDIRGLQDYEVDWYLGCRWVAWDRLDDLPGATEPPGIPEILTALDTQGPWSGNSGIADLLPD